MWAHVHRSRCTFGGVSYACPLTLETHQRCLLTFRDEVYPSNSIFLWTERSEEPRFFAVLRVAYFIGTCKRGRRTTPDTVVVLHPRMDESESEKEEEEDM